MSDTPLFDFGYNVGLSAAADWGLTLAGFLALAAVGSALFVAWLRHVRAHGRRSERAASTEVE